jgi:hypothetical protein
MRAHAIVFVLLATLATAAPAQTAVRAARALPGRVVDVRAGSFFIQAPDSIPAGLVSFRVQALDSAAHVVVIVRIDSGHTVREYLAQEAKGDVPKWAPALGGPIVGGAPGNVSSATMLLEPGLYLLECYFTASDHRSHSEKGMFHPLRVTGPAARAPLPRGDAVITLKNYAFDIAGTLGPGRRTVRVDNPSGEAHELILEWLDASGKRRTRASGLGALDPGRSALITLDLPRGSYRLRCVFPAPDGKPHAAHGMERIVRVE